MTYQAITSPCSPHIGAEIGDIDLTGRCQSTSRGLNQAFTDHLVIFFRDQRISFDGSDQGRQPFRLIGPPCQSQHHQQDDRQSVRAKFHYDETSKMISGENWHSDQSCAAVPRSADVYNHTIPPDGGGDTMFASMYAAYDALSPA